MAKDHFVAQTYLRHFGDKTSGYRLHGYTKEGLKSFPCFPADVCEEWDGDINAEFLTNRPELRGDFRAMCEPHWNGAVEAVRNASLDPSDKFVMAAMAATLMTCTPTWRRVTAKVTSDFTRGAAVASYDLAKVAAAEPALETKDVEALRDGTIRVEVDPKYVEAVNTRQLLRHAWTIYNQDWRVLRNSTGDEFVTSDNPFAPVFSGPGYPVTRYLPLAPDRCLEILFTRFDHAPLNDQDPRVNLMTPPKGRISYGEIDASIARSINRLVVQSAENLVLASRPSEGIKRLVEKYANWGVDHEFVEQPVPGENAVYHGTVLRVGERKRD